MGARGKGMRSWATTEKVRDREEEGRHQASGQMRDSQRGRLKKGWVPG